MGGDTDVSPNLTAPAPNMESASGSGEQAIELTRGMIKEKYGVSPKKGLVELSAAPFGDNTDVITDMLKALETTPPENRPNAETDILEAACKLFKTPAIVGRLREVVSTQRRLLTTADSRMAKKIETRVAEDEARAAVQVANEEERKSRMGGIKNRRGGEAASCPPTCARSQKRP